MTTANVAAVTVANVLIVAAMVVFVVLFGLAFLAFGLGLLWQAARNLGRDLRLFGEPARSRDWPSVPGTVLRRVLTRHVFRRHISYSHRIVYAYEVAGRRHTASRLEFPSWWGRPTGAPAKRAEAHFDQGTPVTVYYDPLRPEAAVLDRSRPHLGKSLFFVAFMLPFGAAFLFLGADIAWGAVNEPPQFAPGELPPLRSQVGAVLLLVAGLALAVAAWSRRRAHGDEPLVQKLAAAELVPVGRARQGRHVAVSGKVEPGPAGTQVVPLNGEVAVAWQARIRERGELRREVVGHGEFWVRDDTGRLLVATRGGTEQTRLARVPVDETVQQWIDETLAPEPVPEQDAAVVEASRIAPGDEVVVVGRVSRDGSLRAVPGDQHSLVFARESWPALLAHANRHARRWQTFRIAGLVALLVGVVLIWA